MSSIVVVGASAGGLDALTRLVAQLPHNFAAPILVVHHMSADATGAALLQALNLAGHVPCTEAKNGERIKAGHLYLAPSDRHLMVTKGGKLLVTKGARENRSRPGIDPLFRSAAIAYRNKVIGIVLTGYLDDGTAGMLAIKRCGGVCVVQDPDDAAYPDMPQNALDHVRVDHVVPIAEMGGVLATLLERRPGKDKPIPEDIVIEARIAERVLSDLPSVEAVGDQVPFNCPGCGGVLWEVTKGNLLRYRCHTGHSYTCSVLHAEQTAKIEETLWIALRMFEERKNLLTKMATRGGPRQAESVRARADESDVHIGRIRAMLRAGVDARKPTVARKKAASRLQVR